MLKTQVKVTVFQPLRRSIMKTQSRLLTASVALTFGILISVGCGQPETADNDTGSNKTAMEKVNAADFVLTAEPAGAKSVSKIRESSSNEDKVIIAGRIGGSSHPWVDGIAAFTIVDESLPACGDGEECNCPTPWDYCCESSETIAANSVTIKFVDENKKARRFDPQESLGLDELQTVVIEGTVDRDDTGKFTILAQKLFVRK